MENKTGVISMRTLRWIIGLGGILLPFLLLATYWMNKGSGVPSSISATYWTNGHDLFVGMLIMFSITLLSYVGYDTADTAITSATGAAFLLTALMPCYEASGGGYVFEMIPMAASNIIHGVMAGVGFTLMGVMAFTQFVKGGTFWKKKVYKICGIAIFVFTGFGILFALVPGIRVATDFFGLWFWMESVILWAFGVSWIIKGL